MLHELTVDLYIKEKKKAYKFWPSLTAYHNLDVTCSGRIVHTVTNSFTTELGCVTYFQSKLLNLIAVNHLASGKSFS